MKLCVIPARGGSKRIPLKNIRDFCGKPMIAWSIEAARASGCFDQVVVSTDCQEIADIARLWGADVPFFRPQFLSDDYVATTPVIAHAVQWFHHRGVKPTAVCCLYATAPFVEPSDLKNGLNLLHHAADDRFVFTATSYASPIQRSLLIDPLTGLAHMQFPEKFTIRSQDLEPYFHDAGQFYWED